MCSMNVSDSSVSSGLISGAGDFSTDDELMVRV
jgi:hypothetical protein